MASSSLQKVGGIKEVAIVALLVLVACNYLISTVYSEKVIANTTNKAKIASLVAEKKSLDDFINAVTSRQGIDTLASLKRSPDIKTQLLTGEKKNQYSDIAVLLSLFASAGFRQGITMESITHELPLLSNGYETTNFNLSVHGTYTDLTNFIKKVSQLEALVNLNTLSLDTYVPTDKEEKEKAESQGVVSLASNITGTLFKLRPDAQVATESAAAPAPSAATAPTGN